MYEINNLTFRYMLSDRNSLKQVSLKIKKRKDHSDRRAKRQWKDNTVKTSKKKNCCQKVKELEKFYMMVMK